MFILTTKAFLQTWVMVDFDHLNFLWNWHHFFGLLWVIPLIYLLSRSSTCFLSSFSLFYLEYYFVSIKFFIGWVVRNKLCLISSEINIIKKKPTLKVSYSISIASLQDHIGVVSIFHLHATQCLHRCISWYSLLLTRAWVLQYRLLLNHLWISVKQYVVFQV